jgi:glycosyltransferase involved in cell wall biosynthesis
MPLDPTAEKKFRALATIADIWVVAFARDALPLSFTEQARFVLLPRPPWPIVRQATFFALAPAVALGLVLQHRVEILVAQSPYEGAAGAFVKRLAAWLGRRVALVIESHGDFEASLFLQRRVRGAGVYRWLMRSAAAYAGRHADVLRAVSRSTRTQLESRMPGRPVVEVVTWTDLECFLARPALERSPEPIVLYAGTLVPRKGVHHLVDAFARVVREVPRARLVLVGPTGNPTYAAALRSQVEAAGLGGRVAFLPAVSQAELAERMRRAWVFALPTLSEGLPRVVIEAMAAGTPVVATAVAGIPEVIDHGVTGYLVPAGDVASLASRLIELLRHPTRAAAMAVRARATVHDRFSTRSYVEGYARVLELSRGGSPHEERRAAPPV